MITVSSITKNTGTYAMIHTAFSIFLPAGFYKVFWNDINQHLFNALNYSYTKGLLSITQRRGLITHAKKEQTNQPVKKLEAYHPA